MMDRPTGAGSDALSFVEEWDRDLVSVDPLDFPGYLPPAAGEESVRTGLIRVGRSEAALIECRFERQGGTMGAVAGERVARALRRATDRRLPVVEFVASGGARLQEGMVSLVQMGRTAAAARAHAAAGLLSVAVYRPPTTGGVYASWASLVDLRAAEPGATIGFGGPRVVEQMTGELPPETSHTAESAYRHGLVDTLVARHEQMAWVEACLGERVQPLRVPAGRPSAPDASDLPTDPWAVLVRARGRQRPSGLEWAGWLCDSWVDLHGTDPVIRAGLASVSGRRLVVIAMDRHAHGDAAARPGPAGYRLARRAVRLADRLGLAVLTLVDTPGADPSPAAEAGGVAAELAATVAAMAGCRTPTVALCVGEGGSGGAIALGHADRLLMLAGAVFSIIAPEAASVILYGGPQRAGELARALRITAGDLLALGIVDEVLPEGGAGGSDRTTVAAVRAAVLAALDAARVGDRDRRGAAVTARALTDRAG